MGWQTGGCGGESEGEKWLVKEEYGLRVRTGRGEPKHRAALQSCCFLSALPRLPHVSPAKPVSVLLLGLCGVTWLLQLSVAGAKEL